MRAVRSLVAAMVVGSVLAACGGAAPTQNPGGGSATQAAGGGTPTQAPDATVNGGGGGGGGGNPAGWDQYGKAHVEVTGPDTAISKDMGFLPIASHFGGTDATILYFTLEGSEAVLTVTWSAGVANASYVSTEVSLTGTECSTSNVNIGASSASGSFDCTSAIMVLKSGVSVEGGKLKGNFDAHG